jgi:putative aminopeptidase FrvX
MGIRRAAIIAALATAGLLAETAVPPELERALQSITAANLRGDLSFLASDTLEGRYTPSPGLEVAAEFIASEFRAAGLEPGGNKNYFQTAEMIDRHAGVVRSDMTVEAGAQKSTIPAAAIAVDDVNQAAKIERAPVLVVGSRDPEALKGADLNGKAVIAPILDSRKIPKEQLRSAYTKARAFDRALASSKAAIEIVVTGEKPPVAQPALISVEEAGRARVPKIVVESGELRKWLEHPAAAGEERSVSLELPAPEDRNVTLKNVVGVLRGSDPQLRNTYVLLTAHYDHIGTTQTAGRMANPEARQNKSDHIYNGANDDGSGTVSVIEIGKALGTLNRHPKRSVVFMTFFGEERGEIGSHYYSEHPIFPLAKTVADVNLEQVGRTDSTVGPQIKDASLTGYDYSDVTAFLERAGRETGIRVYMDKSASDPYFTQSDNAAFAQKGVPAHSVTVAYDFADYHGVGDEWEKIDYENMARVDRMLALAVAAIANSAKAPQWNAQNPKTAPFREAQRKLEGQ